MNVFYSSLFDILRNATIDKHDEAIYYRFKYINFMCYMHESFLIENDLIKYATDNTDLFNLELNLEDIPDPKLRELKLKYE